MPPQKSRPPKKGRKDHFEFSRTSVLFWCLGMFFLLAWIFVLGILVGRGVFPEGIEGLTELKSQIVTLQRMLTREEPPALERVKKRVKQSDREPKFAFYDELGARKEEVPKKQNHLGGTTPAARKKKGKKQDKQIKAPMTGGSYALQLASLESEAKAIRMIARLTNQGFPVYSYKVRVKGKVFYRVRCGTFKTRKEANYYKALLAKEEKINGFVIRVRE